MEFNLINFVLLGLASFMGGLIQGALAFGMAIFMVIVLAWFYPASSLVPFVTLAAAVNLFEVARLRRVGFVSIFSPVLFVSCLIGVIIGTVLLVYVPDRAVKAALGLFIAGIGVLFVFNPPRPHADGMQIQNEHWEPWGWGKSIVTGIGAILSGWITTGGPPLVLYAYSKMPLVNAQRYLVRSFLLMIVLKLVSYSYYSLWSWRIFLWAVICMGPVLVGTSIGHRIADRIDSARFQRAVWIAFTVMGFFLLIRTVASGS